MDAPTAGCSLQPTDSADLFLGRIAAVIQTNMGVLLGCAVVVGISAMLIIVLVRFALDIVRAHRARTFSTLKEKKEEKNKGTNDDIIYGTPDGLDSDLPGVPEATRILGSLAVIKAKYSGYNRAISTHLRKKGRSVDDVIDQKIVDRREDDFKYEKKKRNPSSAPPAHPYGKTSTEFD